MGGQRPRDGGPADVARALVEAALSAAAGRSPDALSDADALAIRSGLEQAGLKQERRALRLRPEALQWEWLDFATLRLSFVLQPGSYATAVLHELGTMADKS